MKFLLRASFVLATAIATSAPESSIEQAVEPSSEPASDIASAPVGEAAVEYLTEAVSEPTSEELEMQAVNAADEIPSAEEPEDTEEELIEGPNFDEGAPALRGLASNCYAADGLCRYFVNDFSTCRRGLCRGSDIECSCDKKLDCNSYCQIMNDSKKSICEVKSATVSQCKNGGQACGAAQCAPMPTTTTTTPKPTTTKPGATTKKPTTTAKPTTTTTTPTPGSDCYHSLCQKLNGASDYCKHRNGDFTCQKGGQSCKCADGSTTTTTTRAASTTAKPATTTKSPSGTTTKSPVTTPKPVTTTKAPTGPSSGNGGCESMPAETVNVAMWTEWPHIGSDRASIAKYYQTLRAYLDSNCANIRTTKLILRVLHPSFPTSQPADSKAFWPPATAPLYTELLSKLSSSVEVHIYPYVMGTTDQKMWKEFGGSDDVVANVYSFVAQWDSFLKSQGSGVRIKGAVFDLEEVRNWPEYKTQFGSANIKKRKGSFSYSSSIGFDQLGLIGDDFTDEYFLQVYDLYAPTASIGKTTSSRFLTLKNNPEALADYIINEATTEAIWKRYSENLATVTMMWSTQNLASGCIYPSSTGKCGVNYEFGSWGPDAFNKFILALQRKQPIAAKVEHAIFQFNYTPYSWMPRNYRTCEGTGC
jgi:hypothetical protein